MPLYYKRKSLHRWISTYWERPHWSQKLLAPLSLLFAVVVFLRRRLYRLGVFKSVHFQVPIWIVGNIRVGGSGKTPVVIALVHFLKSKGLRVGVVSRGYGRVYSKAVYLTKEIGVEAVGDEPLLIFKETGVPVAVAAKRTEAVCLLLQQDKLDVIVSDDGLQHYAMGRSLEICVQEPLEHIPNRFMYPVGPWREPLSRLKDVDFVWESGHTIEIKAKGVAVSLLLPQLQKSLKDFSGKTVHAVAGIARPWRFFNLLQSFGIQVIPHIFADHHLFTEEDFHFARDAYVLMTAKDAIKCTAFAKQSFFSVPIEAVIAHAALAALEEKLRG